MFHKTTMPELLALAAAGAVFGRLPYDRVHGYLPPADPGHFKSNGSHSRAYTRDDARAKRKRVAKRRAKKGYK